MDKEFLKSLGIEGENAEKIINLAAQELKDKYVSIDRFNEGNTELENRNETVKTLNGQLTELKKVDPAKLQSEIERLQGENKTAQAEFENKINGLKLSNAVEKALTAAKAKNITAVKALLNMDDVTLDGDTVKGLDKQIKALAADEGTKFLFDTAKPEIKGSPDGDRGEGGGETSKGAQFAERYNNGIFSRQGIKLSEE